MLNYTVIWHYIANHGVQHVLADCPTTACRKVIDGFGNPEFTAKARLFAFEGIHVMRSAKEIDEDRPKVINLEVEYPIGTEVNFDFGGALVRGKVTGHRGSELEITGWLANQPADSPDGRYWRSPSDYVIRKVGGQS